MHARQASQGGKLRKQQRTAAASKSARLLRLVLAQARGLRPGDMRAEPSRKAGPPPPPPLYGLSALGLRMLPLWVGLPGLMLLLMTPMPAHGADRQNQAQQVKISMNTDVTPFQGLSAGNTEGLQAAI